MAVADASIGPRILTCARKAFLKNGYEKTCLKDICKEAGVTTGALYKRYAGKEALFCALVEESVKYIGDVAATRNQQDPSGLTDRELYDGWDMYSSTSYSWSMQGWFDFLYERKDEFTLILTCSAGTRYANFIHDWVDMMTRGTYQYYLECEKRGMVTIPISIDEMRILLSAFWTTINEPFLYSFTKEQLDTHCGVVCRIFNWYEILGLRPPE